VIVSGATVLIAMAGMFLAGSKIFTSIAIGTMLVVLCAVAAGTGVVGRHRHGAARRARDVDARGRAAAR
jgi:hypothetical protein